MNVFVPGVSGGFQPVQKLQISQYVLEGIDSIFSKIPQDHYILCVGYIVDEFVVDCQLGVTGSTLKDEFASECAEREVKEELSLVLPAVQLIHSVFVKRQFESQCFMSHTFVCNVSGKKENTLNQQLHHTYKERVSVFVHGSLLDLETLLVKNKYVSASKDKAGYIGIISLQTAKEIYNHIMGKQTDLRGTFLFDINKKKPPVKTKCWCGSETRTNRGSKAKWSTNPKPSQKWSCKPSMKF